MKNSIYFSALFFAVIFFASCGQCPDCPEVPNTDDDNYTATLKDTISNAKFDLWVSNWKNFGQSFTAGTAMEYYTLPLIDLEEFLQHPGTGRDTIAAARFVLGLEISGTDTIPHLVLVGVDSAGKSMTDPLKQQYIYDVSMPCPSSCGINSLPK